MSSKILEAWKRGYKEVKKECGFDTVLNITEKKIKIKDKVFIVPAGVHCYSCGDELMGKWMLICNMLNEEFKKGSVTTEDITCAVLGLEGEENE